MVWDVADAQSVGELTGHEGAVFAAALSADGRFALSGGYDRTVRFWRLDDGPTPKREVVGEHDGPGWAVACNGEGTEVLSGGHDQIIRRWKRPD